MYSLSEAASDATGYVNDLGQDVNIGNLQDAIENARNSISDFNYILKDMKDNNGLTSDGLDKIVSKYPKLLAYINDEDRLRVELQNSIKEQNKVAEDYYKSVLEMDTDLYNSVVKNNSDRVNKLSEYYGTDISNWKSIAQAKADIDGKLLQKLNEKWGDYYSQRAKLAALETEITNTTSPIIKQSNELDLFGVGGLKDPNADFLNKQKESLKDLSKEAKTAQSNYDDLKNLFVDTDYTGDLSKTASKIKSSTGNKSSKSEFSQQIDQIARSVDLAEKSVSNLNDVLDEDAPYKKQISNLQKLINGQKQLETTYKKAAKAYKTEYQSSISGLSEKYIKQIQSGGTFSIQDFKGESGEKLYNQITTAQKYWDSYNESLEKANDTTLDIVENTAKIKELKVDKILEPFVKKSERQQGILDDVDQSLNFVDDGSIEQLQLLETGYFTASKSAENLKKEISALNKAYNNNKTDENYKTRLAELESQLGDSASAMKSYQEEIVSSMKERYDDQLDGLKDALDDELDAIETAHKAKLEALDDELDAYKKIIDAQKEALDIEKEKYEYEKLIAQKTKDISNIQDRITELQRAANSGDRSASLKSVNCKRNWQKSKKI
jgi:DNA repair exonuclease SbcCD ATPase subunit